MTKPPFVHIISLCYEYILNQIALAFVISVVSCTLPFIAVFDRA